MSYTPTIIIYKPELEAALADQEPFWDWTSTINMTDEQKAIFELYEALEWTQKDDVTTPSLKGVLMVVCTPEFASHNASVRDWLDDQKISYTLWD